MTLTDQTFLSVISNAVYKCSYTWTDEPTN